MKFYIREKPKFGIKGKTLRIEKLKTRIKMREALRFTGTPRVQERHAKDIKDRVNQCKKKTV